MKTNRTKIVLAVSLILVAFSGLLVLNDSNKIKTYEDPEMQIRDVSSERKIPKEPSGSSEENIVQRVEVQDTPFELHGYWERFETVTINIDEFENAAADGSINLRLLQKDFEIEIEEISRLSGGKSYRYSGHVKEIPQSKATFYVCGTLFSGSIESEDLTYNIAVTSSEHDGKTVHAVYVTNWKKDRERLKLALNPLKYFVFKQEIETVNAVESSSSKQLYIDLISIPQYFASIGAETAEGIKTCREK